MKTTFLYFIFTCIHSLQSMCQSTGYMYYNFSDHLPNCQVYELLEDKRGYIWALTDKGIHRYNGAGFEEISIAKSLTKSIPIDALEDNTGTIWFLFMNGNIGSYNYLNKNIHPHPMNTEIQQICSKSEYIKSVMNNSFQMTDDGGLIYSYYHLGIILVYPKTVENIKSPFNNRINIVEVKGAKLACHSQKEKNNQISKTLFQFNIFGKVNSLIVNPNTYVISGGAHVFFREEPSGNFLVNGNILIRIENNEIKAHTVFDSAVLGLKELEKGTLTVFFGEKKPIIIDLFSLDKLRDTSFPLEFVSYCIEDREGGVWYSTLYNGIVYAPPVAFSKYELTKDKQISAIRKWNDKLYYGTLNGEIGYLSNGKIHQIASPGFEREITHFVVINNALHALTNNVLLKLKNDRIVGRFPEMDYRLEAKDICVINDTLFLARNNGLQYIFNNELYYNQSKVIDNKSEYVRLEALDYQVKMLSICKWGEELYGAIENTVQKLNVNSQKFDTVLISNHKIECIRANQYGFFYSTSSSVCWIDPISSKKQYISLPPHFYVNQMYLKEDVLWVTAMNGIYKIDLNSKDFSYEIMHIQLGRNNENIDFRKLDFSEKVLYVGSSKGIFEVAYSELDAASNDIEMYFNRIENNGHQIDLTKSGEFSFDQNNMVFHLDVLKNNNRSNIIIEYRLSSDAPWEKTTELKITFPFLAPNYYSFQARACVNDNCSELQTYSFVILAPFWERTSTKAIIIISILLLVLWYFQRRIVKIRKKQANERKILALEKKAKKLHQQALSAQINPHFMFNALSSIQAFILENDTMASEKYLTDFSHLMRLILESSMEEFIEIDKEVKMLHAYLNLEQLRYQFSFQFQVKCADTLLDERLKIPAMILQPLVENAIEHGVKGSDSGVIQLHFSDKDSYVECTVMDNGNRYFSTKKIFDGVQYKSRATSILKDRIKVLQIDYPETTFERIQQNSAQNKGTLIKVILPLIS